MAEPFLEIENFTVAYGENVIMHDVSFTVNKEDVFIIMGGSGCGKSTLLSVLTGLKQPVKGSEKFVDKPFWGNGATKADRNILMRKAGILYQSGALWSSMTLAENIAMPLEQYTTLCASEIKDIVALKLDLVGLGGFQNYYPAEISGGMKKRAGLARALALDPEVVFFDEPSAGLDPISSKNLDDLILQIKENMHTTIVMVTHELPSIFAIGTNSIYLDAQSKTIIARGDPKELLRNPPNQILAHFLTRGEK
ncbi:MAG: ATP-binding cassette domain-containing protein [Alphaproteobacteria bacterium]|nr:ATP-binding cassette domain-containing protein [Alphaproteobacteria bacterium]